MQTDVIGKGLLSYALKVSAKTAETIRPTAAAFTPGSSLRAPVPSAQSVAIAATLTVRQRGGQHSLYLR